MRHRVASAAFALSLFGGAALPATLLAPVASAHSVLLTVDPADGATVEASPEAVVLTFNEDVNQSFASVAVTAEGEKTNLAAGEPVVDGATVTAEVDELDAGAYTIGYRVTSADGHVITGSSAFTVEPAGGASGQAPGAGAEGSAGAGDPAATAPDGAAHSDGSADAADQAAADSGDKADDAGPSGFGTALWVVGGLGVVLLGAGFVLLRRGK